MATLDQQMNSALNQDEEQADITITGAEATPTQTTEEPPVPASVDASGALPQDISAPPEVPSELTPAEAERQRLQGISGLQPMDMGKTLPEKIQQSITQPVYELSSEKQTEYYNRFFKYDDAELEGYNRSDLEAASVYYVPKDEKAYMEGGMKGAVDSTNFDAYVFPEGMSVEAKAAVMATSGAHSFGYKLPESQTDDPFSQDSYLQVQPRYMADLQLQRTPKESEFEYLSAGVLSKRELGKGKEEQAKILTQMGMYNPADQLAVLSAVDVGAFESERLLSGATQVIDLVGKAFKWTGRKYTQGVTTEQSLFLPNGVVVSMQESGDLLISTQELAERQAAVANNPENEGMFTLDAEGNAVLRPEFSLDYAGALAAEGYDPAAAEEFVTYMPDAASQSIRLLGEEVLFGGASAGLRYGIAMGQVAGFNRWVNRTYGSADDAFKKGKDGSLLVQEYFKTYEDGMFNDWARNMAMNSMRIKLDVHGNLPGFGAVDQVKAIGERIDGLRVEHGQLLKSRDTIRNAGGDVTKVEKQMAQTVDRIKKAEAAKDAALSEVYNGSWIGDTVRTTTYGVAGAALAGEIVTEHFGGAEYAPLAEVLGFLSGHTAMNIMVGGTAKSLKFAARTVDKPINLAASIFGVMNPNLLERLGAYDALDGLNKQQKAVISSLQNLSPTQRQAAIANARYVTDLQNTLSGIKDAQGRPIFSDDMLAQTLGVITGLNLLTLADNQLTKGLSVGELKELGPGFYAKQELLDQKTDLVRRLNMAVEQLLPVSAMEGMDERVKGVVKGLDSYRKQLNREIETNASGLQQKLNEREQLIMGAIVRDPKAMRELGLDPDKQIEAKDIHNILAEDDKLFMRAQSALGVPADEALANLNQRIDNRMKNLTEASKSYMQAVNGSAYAGGPETIATQVFYTTRAGHYGKATAKYDLLQDQYGDSALMSVTEVYDELAKNPALTEQFDAGVQSRGALRFGGLDVSRDTEGNFRLVFNDAADRTMTGMEERLRAYATGNGVDPDMFVDTLYERLGTSSGDLAINRWEAFRNALQGRGEASPDVVAMIGGPEQAKAFAAKMPLLININEFQNITSGLNVKIRNVYAKKPTGKDARADRYLVDIMHDAATNPATGFKFNYFDKNSRAPATVVYDALMDANKTYREEYADRYLRGGPSSVVGKGVTPAGIPNLDKARTTGVVEKDQIFDVFVGEMKGGVQSLDRVDRISSNLAQSYGVRIPEEGTEVLMRNGQTKTLPGGKFVFVEGDATTEALRSALTLHMIDELRRSPGGKVIRDWIGGRAGTMTEAAQVEAIMKGLDTGDFDLTYVENLARMPMLRQRADGTFEEVPLIDVDRAYQEINLSTAMKADQEIAFHVDDAQRQLKTFINRMKDEARVDASELRDTNKALAKSIESLGENPADFFQKQFESGTVGFQETQRIREALVAQAKQEARDKGFNAQETEALVKQFTDNYDTIRADHFSAWVGSQTQGSTQRLKVEVDPDTGMPMPQHVKGFKAGKLAEILGVDGGPNAAQRRELALDMLGGDEEHFANLEAVANWGLITQAQTPSGVTIDDIPTGLSIESWISRVYSINRGVVSPRYVGAEALIQSFRLNGFNLVQAMVNDKKLAAKVQEILVSGKPLQTEQANFELMQALMTASGMAAARWDKLDDTEDRVGEDEEVEIIQPAQVRPVDEQMMQMQTLPGGA